MREKEVEKRLFDEVKKRGGRSVKFVSPSFGGMPDRLVLFPKGRLAFVELKSHGKEPNELQRSRHEMLRRLGFRVYVIDKPEQIGGVLDEILST